MMDATEIIEALGGAQQIADMLGLGRSAVYNWNRAGVPPVHYRRLSEIASELGVAKPFRDRRGKRQPGVNLHTLVGSEARPGRAKPRHSKVKPDPLSSAPASRT